MAADQWPGVARLNDADIGVAALTYVRAGLPVFPVFGVAANGRCECGEAGCDRPAKHPRVKWTKEATCDEGEITSWWTQWPRANIGLPTGAKSGLVVIDMDLNEIEIASTVPGDSGEIGIEDGEAELSQLLERELGIGWDAKHLRGLTLVARTGSGGTHAFLKDPGGVPTIPRWLPAVDLRGDGGYVVLPPSRHVSGGTYTWLTESAPWVPEARLAAQLRMARGTAAPGRNGNGNGQRRSLTEHDADGVNVGYREAKKNGAPEGERDAFFNRYAFELRKLGVDRVRAIAEIRRVWELTPGGGQPSTRSPASPYHWETALDKVKRVWDSVDADPDAQALEPVADELAAWAQAVPSSASVLERSESDPLAQLTQASTVAPDATADVPPPAVAAAQVSDTDLAAERASDLGNGTRFARLFRDRVRHVAGMGWFIWNGVYWKPDDAGLALQLTREVIQDINDQGLRERDEDKRDRWLAWALASENHGRLIAMLKIAATDPRLSVSAAELDPHPHLLTCPNGTVNLNTGELEPNDPANLSTNCTGVDYIPQRAREAVPLLDDFHATFLPDIEQRDYTYNLIGGALFGGNRMRAFIFLQGGTTSGKSTWVEGVRQAMGSYATPVNSSVFRGALDDKPRPDLMRIMRVRLAVAEEAGSAWELHTDQIKRITGGDSIVARGMSSNVMVERRAEFTPVVVTNELPHLTGMDEAAQRRIIALSFDQSLPVEQVDIRIKPAFLADERVREALLARLVGGCLSWKAESELMMPASVKERTREVHEELDSVAEFLREMVREHELLTYDAELSAGSSVKTMDLYQQYKRWTRDNRGSRRGASDLMGSKGFSQRLERLPGWEKVRSNGTRWLGWQLAPLSQIEDLYGWFGGGD